MSFERRHRRGFNLVELLVVLGVIAVLVALLLPSLARAREQANQVKCLASLHAIGLAAHVHVAEHKGYLPAAGWQFSPVNGLLDPAGLDDAAAQRYDYFQDDGIRRPVPVTVALGMDLDVDFDTSSRAALEQVMLSSAMRRRFTCPSQQQLLRGCSQRDGASGWTAPTDLSSYVFNEAILGRRPGDGLPQVVGNVSRISDPATVMQAMDGRPRNMTNDNWIMVFNAHPDDTLYDFVQITMIPNNGFGKQTLDYYRHLGRANVLFVDGHVQSMLLEDEVMKTIRISTGRS